MNTQQDRRPRERQRVAMPYAIVAGTSGGVGTTTVTALLADALHSRPESAPLLADHTDGRLAARLPLGVAGGAQNGSLGLHDLGAHAGGAALEQIAAPNTVLLLITSATEVSLAAAGDVTRAARERHGEAILNRMLLVPVAVAGRGMRERAIERTLREFGHAMPTVAAHIPSDFALRAGGRIQPARMRPATKKAQARLADAVGRAFGALGSPTR